MVWTDHRNNRVLIYVWLSTWAQHRFNMDTSKVGRQLSFWVDYLVNLFLCVWPLDSPGKLLNARKLYCAFKYFVSCTAFYVKVVSCFQACFLGKDTSPESKVPLIFTHLQIIWLCQLLKETLLLTVEFYSFPCSDNRHMQTNTTSMNETPAVTFFNHCIQQ